MIALGQQGAVALKLCGALSADRRNSPLLNAVSSIKHSLGSLDPLSESTSGHSPDELLIVTGRNRCDEIAFDSRNCVIDRKYERHCESPPARAEDAPSFGGVNSVFANIVSELETV